MNRKRWEYWKCYKRMDSQLKSIVRDYKGNQIT